MKVLVTGGMGYIGSHTCVQMIEAGMEPIIVDNLCNAKLEVLNRIEALVSIENDRSIRLLHRLGFKQEGLFRDYYYFDTKYNDDYKLGNDTYSDYTKLLPPVSHTYEEWRKD